MNRGSGTLGTIRARGRGCFNEAPIHESGKSRPYRATCSQAYRFNEAPIHESGKKHTRLPFPRLRIASMRPRFMNRGSTDRLAQRLRQGLLQ